ncbi:MAG: DUF1624 domain-containing protein [Oscillospiraceae bacterium]|nr:DUF1624 domain-containing protein [Oscillospiraceae bacterium]
MTKLLEKPNKTQTGRLYLLDELRGLLILNVVAYHTLFDLCYMFGVDMPWFRTTAAYWWQQWMSGSLIFLAGISCLLTRSNLRRGLKTLGWAMVLTVGTWFVMSDQLILFGVLHFFGCAMLLFALLRPLLDKIPPKVGLVACLALFVFTKNIYYGNVGIPYLWEVPVPEVFYSTKFLFPLGLPHPHFQSSDYFPLIPWLFLFLAGSFLGRKIPAGKVPAFACRSRLPLLGAIGRRTLVIYLVHQPVIYALLFVLFHILG